MLRNLFLKPEKKLGKSRQRHYDIPLGNSPGNDFLKLIILLMSALTLLSLATSFVLGSIKNKWTSGLENKMTIEIPAHNEEGTLIDREKMQKNTQDIASILQTYPAITSVTVMSDEDVNHLLSPWLGGALDTQDMPIPSLITVTTQPRTTLSTKTIEKRLSEITPGVRIDTHEAWLQDVLGFTGALQFASALIALIIGITTIASITGAIRSRMAEFHYEIELLHMMGASDSYIMSQFQKHTFTIAVQGAAGGIVVGFLILTAIAMTSQNIGQTLLPDFSMTFMQYVLLVIIPFILVGLATITARWAVFQNLAKLP